jgi:nucleoporin POM152
MWYDEVTDLELKGSPAKTSYFTSVLDNVGLAALVPASSSSHLLGQHTVRMSPLSTAELNVNGDKFCISQGPVIIPVLLNNTSPSLLRYSLTPLPGMDGKTEYFDLSSRDLRSNDDSKLRLQHMAATHAASSAEEDEYDDEDDVEGQGPSLQKSQTIAHLHISKPGVLRLEKVVHSNSVEARLAHPSLLVIAPCPSAAFVDENVSEEAFIRCAGSNPDVQMTIDVRGVPPLSLHWSKRLGHSVEHFDVQGIDGHLHRHSSSVEGASGPQALRIPLVVTASDVGTHRYTLESVSDGLGNVIQIGPSSSMLTRITHPVDSGLETQTDTSSTRIVQVLPRPQISFSGCSLSYPSRLMIDQQTTLTIRSKDLDKLTSPVEVVLSYAPTLDQEDIVSQKELSQKAWTKSIMIDNKDTPIQVDAPGEYTIVSAQGTRCEAEILSPDICKVVELPRPSADIEWKRIHEW